ncbi:SDR family NAD(P)-dependent oxidoreductase [Aliihoeflea sp. PC F10.4]
MDFALKGRTAYITGGGGGLGRETALYLAREGCAIALIDLDVEVARSAAEWLAKEIPSTEVVAVHADVRSEESVGGAFASCREAIGDADILVNNAGFSRDGYMAKMPLENWETVHDVVLKGSFLCSRAALPAMMSSKWGRIVNISSIAYRGMKGQTNYSAAKAGLIGMTRALASEAGGFGITCNAIAPGLIATPRLRARPDFIKLEQQSIAGTPIPRVGETSDVAKAVLFFVSPLADYVSGQVLEVAGGR